MALPTLHTEDSASLQLEIRIYGEGHHSALLVEEVGPNLPYDEARINRVEFAWNPFSQEIVASRSQPDLAPIYSVAKYVVISAAN